VKFWQLGIMLAGAVLIALLWLLHAVNAQRPKGGDAEQIRAVIAACDRAASRRDAATINRYLSNEYRDSFGFRADQARIEVGRVLGSARQVQIYVPRDSEAVSVNPDGRHAAARFELHLQTTGGQAGGLTYNGTLYLRLQKEPVRYFLVFPGSEWRITSAEGYSPDSLE
jgi:hypothetical protein